MSLKERILADLKDAMKKQQADRLSAIRFLQSAIKNREIELRPNSITDQDILSVIRKSVKQRKDSIEQFLAAGRQDLVDKERFELQVVEEYLPAQMDEAQVRVVVDEVVARLGATSMKEMGSVMKEVQTKVSGLADAKLVADLVKARLQA